MAEGDLVTTGAAGDARDRLIVALDCSADEALALAHALVGTVRWLKVGMTLFYQSGPDVTRHLVSEGFDVFLDLKLHDIPHQVYGAARQIASLGAKMLTVHASGGRAMLQAALAGARDGAAEAGCAPPSVIAVTVLTSLADEDLSAIGFTGTAGFHVERLVQLASHAGLAGVVCSPHEAALVRGALGESALVVTPGVRPSGSAAADQSRVATPAQALAAGASHIVVGRPITEAASPAAAARGIIAEMEGES